MPHNSHWDIAHHTHRASDTTAGSCRTAVPPHNLNAPTTHRPQPAHSSHQTPQTQASQAEHPSPTPPTPRLTGHNSPPVTQTTGTTAGQDPPRKSPLDGTSSSAPQQRTLCTSPSGLAPTWTAPRPGLSGLWTDLAPCSPSLGPQLTSR